VVIKGDIDNPSQAKKIRALAQAVPGVKEVNLDQLALTTRI
jgi:osmotically-inducible protein OsmY